MLQVSKEKRAFVVEKLFERKSYVAVHAAFQQRFNQALPCKKTIQQNITKYRSHEANLNRDKKNYGRRRSSARSEERIELVKNILENNINLTGICTEKYGGHVQ